MWRNIVENIKKNYPIYLMIFIVFQPVLDLLTFLFKDIVNFSITPGLVIRMLILILSCFYLLTRRKKYLDKKDMYYLVVYSVFLVVHFSVNFLQKNSFNLIRELAAVAKTSYFLLFFLVFIVSFKEIKEKQLKKLFPINISFSMFIINVIMMVATITGTGKRSYGALYKIGHSGWFYAANDIGVILAIAFPILMWIAFENKNIKSMVFNWVNILLTILSLFTIGTKVGHLAVVITLVIASISYTYDIFINNRNQKTHKINLTLSILLAILILVFTPYLPAYTNSTGQIAALIDQSTDIEKYEHDIEKYEHIDESEELSVSSEEDFFGESSSSTPELVDGVIYSGRTGFLSLHQEYFEEAPLSQKIFGMGYAGNYEKTPKLIERDFHDIYYQFGVFGFLLFIFPFIYYGLIVLKYLFNNLRDFLSVENTMVCSSIVLGLGISYLSGHTLTSPAVSIYLALILSYKVVEVKYEKVG